MANLNRVLLIGNLTRDPEVRHTPKGTAVADLGLAINRTLSGGEDGQERREEVTYVDVTVWGRQAEIAEQYLAKGRSVFIEGRLQLDSWDDHQTGQKRSKLKVVCENLQLVGSRSEPNGASGEVPKKERVRAAFSSPKPPPQRQRAPDSNGEGALEEEPA